MKVVTKNRKAGYNFELMDKYCAGMKLVGSEVRPIKDNQTSINEAYCYFKDGDLYVKNMYIKEHAQAYDNHDPYRERKLLLNKKELKKLQSEVQIKGLSIIPTAVLINDKGLVKIEIALAKGKKLWDKRETIKERDAKREMDRKTKY